MVKIHPFFEEDVIRLTGIVAIEGAFLDMEIGLALARLTGRPEVITDSDEFAADTRKKVERLQGLTNTPAAIIAALSDWKSISADRNYAIHGLTLFTAPDLNSAKTGEAMRGKYVGRGVVRDATWLADLVERISKVTTVFVDFLHDTSPSPDKPQS